MSTTTNLPSTIAGRYRVIRELGRGGMGAVYLVEHVHTGEQLALKVLLAQEALHAEAIERFKREARAPAKIRSEYVVRVTDADVAPELNGAPFMVMEALQGKDLEAVVKERGKLPPTEIVWILGQVASALDKAHAIGIIHRDLKPENIFLHTRDDGSPIIKILDFGISKIREKDGDPVAAAGLTQTGAVMGTPLYMSPEQARGRGQGGSPVGPQTDIWALGLVTLRLLSGDIYWHSIDTLADLLMKIMVDPMEPPSARWSFLPINVDAWFAKSCERDPTKRFQTVGEQVRAFTAVVNGTSISAVPPITTSSPQFGGTMVLGASTPGHSAQHPFQTGPNVQANPNLHGTPQPTGPHLPQVLHSTPGPISSHQTGPGQGAPYQAASVPLAQTGPNGEQLPFAQLQSTTSGGAMVRPSVTTDAPRASSGGKIALVLAPIAVLLIVGGIGASVYVPKWRSHAVEVPSSTASTTATASITTGAPEASTGSLASASASASTGLSTSPPPSASAVVVVVKTTTKPTAAPPPTLTTTATTAARTATTPTTKPTASAKFNPEAP